MELFNTFGLDFKIILAQILNFLILLFILKKFLYKPIIHMIEQGEDELKKADVQKKSLESDIKTLTDNEKNNMESARNEARKIISDAENLAIQIKSEAQKETEKRISEIIEHYKSQFRESDGNIDRNKLKEQNKKIIENLSIEISKIIESSKELKNEIQDVYFNQLLEQLDKINNKNQLVMKNSDIVLSYAYPYSPRDKDLLIKQLKNKSYKKYNLVEKKDPELIAGFNLEINGLLIESNLLSSITNATK